MSAMFKIAFVVLYSEKFAMTGESHGVSVLAGVVQKRFNLTSEDILILDMYGLPIENKISHISNNLAQFNPDIIGFSCPYGSYTTFVENYIYINKFITKSTLMIFGGALPTYIPEKYLELDKSSYVIRGEGEDAIVGLIIGVINNELESTYDFSVPKRFIEDSFKKLEIGGYMYMVTKRKKWYKNKLISVFGGVQIKEKDGYFVFISQKKWEHKKRHKESLPMMSKKIRNKMERRKKKSGN